MRKEKKQAKLTSDIEVGDGGDDALVVMSFAHELAGVVREDFAQRQNGSPVFQVIDAEILGRLDLFAVQIPEHRRPWITLHFHLESIQFKISKLNYYC